MNVDPHRLAGAASTTTTHTFNMRTSEEVEQPSSTIAPYYTALNGVNQPMNMVFKDALWLTLGALGVIILLIRFMEILWAKLRLVSAITDPRHKQGYWKISQWSWMPSLKTNLTYAPLWKKRHNREFRLSSAINVGTLPSRLHMVIIIVYLASNMAYMFVLDWNNENKWAFCAELRGRAGVLALVNMVPLIILAGRNNPLIAMLLISFDTYNLLHRWMGRIVVLEAVIHTIAWAIPAFADGGWRNVQNKLNTSLFVSSGTVGTVALVVLLVLSVSPFRHAFYETFLNLHILLALVSFLCTWIHCASSSVHVGGLPQLPWIIAVVMLWLLDRLARVVRLMYVNWSDKGFTDALCEELPCEAVRVTLRLPRYVAIGPGTHAYLRFWGINSWESHPFSIAWVDHETCHNTLPISTEKDPLQAFDKSNTYTNVSFIIGAHTGMTRKLFDRVKGIDGGIRIKAALEGPYAGHHSLDSYGHCVLFAGATGITHQVSYLRYFLEGYNAGIVATRRITLIWIIRSGECVDWVRPYMDSLLRIPNRRDILRIQIYITRPTKLIDIQSASFTVKVIPGRPNVGLALSKEVQEQIGAMCVTVCGPGGLADDVRSAVRAVQGHSVVDFIEESFTW